MTAAKSDARVGRRPIVVQAQKYEIRSNHLILASTDATTQNQLKQMSGVFSQGRVVIITRAAAGIELK
jgi:hypothetical protein